jgi:hypothetical protein
MWTDDLREAVGQLHAQGRGYIVVELVDTPYYVQLMRSVGRDAVPRAVVEAVSNEYLEGSMRLDDDQEATLAALGWQSPGAPCDPVEGCDLEHPNWFRFVDLDASDGGIRSLEAVLLPALAVYGMTEGAAIRVVVDTAPPP